MVYPLYCILSASCFLILGFLFLLVSSFALGHFIFFALEQLFFVEFTWTSTPLFFVAVVLIPMFFSLSALEFFDGLPCFVYGHQWWWMFTSYFKSTSVVLRSGDVIHDFSSYSSATKMDACPRRLQQIFVDSNRVGFL